MKSQEYGVSRRLYQLWSTQTAALLELSWLAAAFGKVKFNPAAWFYLAGAALLKVNVRFFTVLREVAGKREETLQLLDEKVTVASVLGVLSDRYGEAFSSYVFGPQGEVKGFLQFFVNGQASSLDSEMHEGDTLAIVPPVGGG